MNTQIINTTKKAVLYCRVSTKEQVEEGNSLVTQERNCREYALKYGYEVASVFIELGESAKTADRTELQKLFLYCANKKNEISAIIAYKIDRISRNTDDYSQIRILLKRYGVEIKSTSEYFENTPAGRFMENIIANVAQFDNDVRAERSIGGMLQAVREGRYVWMAPIGFDNVKINGKTNLIPNDMARFIKLAYEEVTNRVLNVEEIRLKLTSMGMVNRIGKPISKAHFYKLLKHELYTGNINKFGETHIGSFEPIISKELFNTVQRILLKKKNTNPYLFENPEFPLRRFVKYSNVGEKLTGCNSQGRYAKYPYYRFLKAKVYFPKNVLEENFGKFLNSFSIKHEFISILKIQIKESIIDRAFSKEKTIEKYKIQIANLKEKQKILLQKNLDNIIGDDMLKESMTEIDSQLWNLNQTFEKTGTTEFSLKKVHNHLFEFLENPYHFWQKLPFEKKLTLQWFVFPSGIIIENNSFRTSELSFIFKLKDVFFTSKYAMVTPQRIEL